MIQSDPFRSRLGIHRIRRRQALLGFLGPVPRVGAGRGVSLQAQESVMTSWSVNRRYLMLLPGGKMW